MSVQKRRGGGESQKPSQKQQQSKWTSSQSDSTMCDICVYCAQKLPSINLSALQRQRNITGKNTGALKISRILSMENGNIAEMIRGREELVVCILGLNGY